MLVKKHKRRLNCFGNCGKRILLRYNPSGFCRKCQRENAHKKLKAERKKERQHESEV
jgi:hypothetical protein